MNEAINISKSMVIHGDVTSTDDLRIEGTVIGDVSFERDCELHGYVEGNVSAMGEYDGKLELCPDAVVVGDVFGKDVIVSGATKGLVSAKNHLEIANSAIVQGDLKASTMQINHGSAIEGMLKINPENKDISKVFEI